MSYLSFNTAVGGVDFEPEGTAEEQKEMLEKPMPLKFTWCIWEQIVAADKGGQKKQHQSDYAQTTREVAEFATVQDFWRLWNHIPQPSQLLDTSGGNFRRMVRDTDSQQSVIDAIMIFQKGVKPQWEDTANSTGGHFQVTIKIASGGSGTPPGQIDEYWNNIVLGVIGATVEPAEMITGLRLVDKLSKSGGASMLRMEIWFRDLADKDKVDILERSVKRCLGTKLDGVPNEAKLPKIDIKPHSGGH
mmetsp:Transcript_25859/g.57051  ORF Transcript_25859/g.57051 Transcript_25859/m.57051 type:complete len:246 (-) Transcript_25859:46-783(-)